jgi:hypothetical protein
MACPTFEILLEGPRGGGKSLVVLAKFASLVGLGFGARIKGLVLRKTTFELADLISKSKELFPLVFPGCAFNGSQYVWTFPSGETMRLGYFDSLDDYMRYHGHEYTFISVEELTNWPDDKCYRRLFSLLRVVDRRIPTHILSTTNPSGPGHHWVKSRFKLPLPDGMTVGPLIQEQNEFGTMKGRRVIHSCLEENKALLFGTPDYAQNIAAAAANDNERLAWLFGSWDLVSGGMFGDVWDHQHNVVPDFQVPEHFRLDRSFDWGSAKPFAVGWVAESDGSDIVMRDGSLLSTVRGDLFVAGEWYGCHETKNDVGLKLTNTEISAGIIERELRRGWYGRVKMGPADSAIFSNASGTGRSVADYMADQVFVDGQLRPGVTWTKAVKGPGSRENGWQALRTLFKNAHPPAHGGPREYPGLFFMDSCPQGIRTVPSLPLDSKKTNDVDTNSEDHYGDMLRYRVYSLPRTVKTTPARGIL